MAATDLAPSARPATPALALSLAIALVGAAFYGWTCFVYLPALDPPNFGTDIYDQAWLALREGRLDLPARVLRFEGHYAPDGTGFLYHGVAPLLTRALAAPFVDVGAGSLAPFSIWFWAVLGTGFCHMAFLTVARGAFAGLTGRAAFWSVVLAATLWIGGPGWMLASNIAFYHEAVAVAYGLTGIALWLWSRVRVAGRVTPWVLVGLALCAAAMVHARPHLAVAMYAGVGIAAAQMLWQARRRAIWPVLLATALLGASGGGFLALNEARFGAATKAHGAFAGEGVIYGSVFWGQEDPDGRRASSFREHGRFNPGRILPNGAVYLAAPPEPLAYWWPWHWEMRGLHQRATEERVGWVRIEYPDAGVMWIWTGWMVAAAASLWAGAAAWGRLAGAVVSSAIAAGLIFSYSTITMRYHIDLWLAIAPLALLGVGALAPRLARARVRAPGSALLLPVCATGILFNTAVAEVYRNGFLEHPDGFFGPWSEARCRAIATGRGFDAREVDAICRPPLLPEGVTPRPRAPSEPRP